MRKAALLSPSQLLLMHLVNLQEREKLNCKAGRIAQALRRMDLIILDELVYLPFS